MVTQEQWVPVQREQLTAMERLNLRVSAMINHPVAQMQRWVSIHRLDSDGEAEWTAMLEALAETPELTLSFHEHDTVLIRWERCAVQESDELDSQVEEPPAAPF